MSRISTLGLVPHSAHAKTFSQLCNKCLIAYPPDNSRVSPHRALLITVMRFYPYHQREL